VQNPAVPLEVGMDKNTLNGIRIRRKHLQDLVVIFAGAIIVYILASYYEVFERIVEFVEKHEPHDHLDIDEIITTSLFFMLAFIFYSVRRWREVVIFNNALNQKNESLKEAMSEIKQLKGILPICSHCKNIRDDKGYWSKIEAYIHKHSDAEFSHAICPECAEKYYPDLDLYDDEQSQG
jgi:hypothetical protein